MLIKNDFYKQIYNVFTLKFAFQAIDIFFKYMIIKRLSVGNVGIYLYVLSIILFFSTFSLMGMPVYLQRQIAKHEFVDMNYIKTTLLFILLLSTVAYFFLPAQLSYLKFFVVFVIITNALRALVEAISNGSGLYDIKYKFQLLFSLYLIFLLICMLCNQHINLNIILLSMFLNAVVILGYALVILLRLKSRLKITKEIDVKYPIVFLNLILIYAVSLPYDFSRFYDRFILSHFFSSTFLGLYVFNNFLVIGIYSLMITPMIAVCITALSKAISDIEQQAKIISRYYVYIILVFGLIFIGYVPFSQAWLRLLGLTNYIGTTKIFIYAFCNTFLYALAMPFIIKISITGSNMRKFTYCCASLLLFNIPFMLILIERTLNCFLNGFLLAFVLHFMLCIAFNYVYSLSIYKQICREMYKVIKGGRAEVLAFINPADN